MSPLNQNQQKASQGPKNNFNAYARFSGMAIQMLAIIGIGTFIGVKLDENYPNEHRLYTILLTLGSVIASIVFIIRRIIAVSKDDNK